jgi:hypothetical protein
VSIKADEFIACAQECEREAKWTQDAEVKRSLEELALRWRMMAAEADRLSW